jgi:hypothetical protein
VFSTVSSVGTPVLFPGIDVWFGDGTYAEAQSFVCTAISIADDRLFVRGSVSHTYSSALAPVGIPWVASVQISSRPRIFGTYTARNNAAGLLRVQSLVTFAADGSPVIPSFPPLVRWMQMRSNRILISLAQADV